MVAKKTPAKKTPVARKAPAQAPAKKAAPPKKAPAAPKKVAPAPVAKKSRRTAGDVVRTIYGADLRATVTLDDADRIRALNHEEYWPAGDAGGSEAASAYLEDIASKLDIAAEALSRLDEPVSYFDPRQQDVEYRFSEEKCDSVRELHHG